MLKKLQAMLDNDERLPVGEQYLEALEKIADGQATKVFLPLETSGVLGSIAGIGELLKEKMTDKPDQQPQ